MQYVAIQFVLLNTSDSLIPVDEDGIMQNSNLVLLWRLFNFNILAVSAM